jgi:hypothetical protein
MSNAARVLIADDQADVLEALRLLLPREHFTPTLVTSPSALVDELSGFRYADGDRSQEADACSHMGRTRGAGQSRSYI